MSTSFFWMLLGASIVTLIPRVLPFIVLSKLRLPAWGMRWLGHIPVAVMAALLGQSLLVNNGKFAPQPDAILAAIPAFLVAFFTRSLLGTVLTGMLVIIVLRNLF
ncbi:MAG: branched-chain amino acid ABC transporter [Bacillaceae bacterium G1]|nr:branched-chain amino acid ABC transporter [Bacillota bacterium]OJF17219.1 MAG: branched-chain amino acid ABC transporter [Bacillaceae bacterium G1]